MTIRTASAVAFGVALLTAASPAVATTTAARAAVVTVSSGAPASGPMRALAPLAGTTAPVTTDAVPEVEVTEMDVVVPAVEASGDLVATPDVLEAQAEPDVIVTDEVVTADRVESAVVETADFQTLGVTWPSDAEVADLGLEVRTRADGEWTGWTALEPADDAPDAGTVEAERDMRGGTDALWVGDADAVQLAFAATPESGPDGISLALIGSEAVAEQPTDAIVGSTDDDLTAQTTAFGPASVTSAAVFTPATFLSTTAPVSNTVPADPAPAVPADPATTGTEGANPAAVLVQAPAAPRVISRAEWGAAPQVCTPDVARGLVGAVVHHTAGSNDYKTVAEAMNQIRNDQAYHINTRGWCDIGYNFVVDKWGNIYEGRADSLNAPVIGVHAGGFNTGTVGVSMLGNFSSVATPPAMIDAVGRIVGLRLAAYNINPTDSFVFHTLGGENSKFAAGTDVPLPRVFAHRDVAYTACPGNVGYGQLPNIRTTARAYYDATLYAESQSVIKALYQDLLRRGPDPTGLRGWTTSLMQGQSQSALVDTLTRSDEYISSRVTKAYREVLGREPEPAGAAAWLSEIKAGHATVDDVQRRFYDSVEYYDISGGTPQGYVRRLYQTVLSRPAGDAEVAEWSAVFATRGRGVVVDAIWFSNEAARIRAGAYYQTFLGRGPDPVGLAGWADVLLRQGEGAVRVGIAGSLEYRARSVSRFP
ncbi:DUF4214 domain-containing protein [Cellulomonas sp. KRMCY2]|uniref:DUF4214 domain-containing protein n=1 Tax=Cellulomonas sp. KRMCY2 TaxID=1304865 RepID=UPI00045E8C63|nr:DUF4214 domain-containing protein [Cellulomonas sp. KRMCY2]